MRRTDRKPDPAVDQEPYREPDSDKQTREPSERKP